MTWSLTTCHMIQTTPINPHLATCRTASVVCGSPHVVLNRTALHVSPTALATQSDGGSVEAALSSLPGLISSLPADLSEVCVELARVLLHCQDSWVGPSFSSLRHTALVALTTTRPHLLAPYLTTEFYSPNHNIRQRLDILEVTPRSITCTHTHTHTHTHCHDVDTPSLSRSSHLLPRSSPPHYPSPKALNHPSLHSPHHLPHSHNLINHGNR